MNFPNFNFLKRKTVHILMFNIDRSHKHNVNIGNKCFGCKGANNTITSSQK